MQSPMFPLEVAMLPGEELPLRIFEPRYSALVRDCLDRDDPTFGVVLIARGREVGGGDERCDVGVLARIAAFEDHGEGRYRLRCQLSERIRVIEWLPDDPYPRAVVEPWPDEPGDADPAGIAEVEDLIVGLFERVSAARGAQLPERDVLLGGPGAADTGKRLYALAARLPIGAADRYAVLAAPSAAARLVALREAVDTVMAMVEFQLGAGG